MVARSSQSIGVERNESTTTVTPSTKIAIPPNTDMGDPTIELRSRETYGENTAIPPPNISKSDLNSPDLCPVGTLNPAIAAPNKNR